jgi:hypothetical protein
MQDQMTAPAIEEDHQAEQADPLPDQRGVGRAGDAELGERPDPADQQRV